jgi:hypothetical protein
MRALTCAGVHGILDRMSTVAEIEKAIQSLPPEEWAEIRRWMDAHTPASAQSSSVDWTKSAAVARQRLSDTRLPAEAVASALSAVRE